MKSFQLLLPLYVMMKIGYFVIPFFFATLWGMPWSLLIVCLAYMIYVWYECQTEIKTIELEPTSVEIHLLNGKIVTYPVSELRCDVDVYKGSKFFETKTLTINGQHKAHSTYWGNHSFDTLLESLEKIL